MFSNFAHRPVRAVATALVAGGLVLGTAACAPSTTDIYYGASDGTRVTLEAETLEVINLMILSSGEGGQAVVHGAVHNTTASTDDVATLKSEDGAVNLTVPVAAGATVNLSTDNVAGTEIATLSAQPGSTLSVQFSDQAGNTVELHVPVLDASLPEYKDYIPSN